MTPPRQIPEGSVQATTMHPRRPAMIPQARLPYLAVPEVATPIQRSVVARSSSSTTPSSTCGPNDNTGKCQKPTAGTMTTTLPIALGAALPLLVAIVVLFIIHRRHVKRVRAEDADDRHKSLDFGLEVADSAGGPRQMSEAGRSRKLPKGVSIDLGNPYLLPPEVHNSRESLQSLSRSIGGVDDDKYRPAHLVQGDNGSLRSVSRGPLDETSSMTGSARFGGPEDGDHALLRHAQRMSQSLPPRHQPGGYSAEPGSGHHAASPDDYSFDLHGQGHYSGHARDGSAMSARVDSPPPMQQLQQQSQLPHLDTLQAASHNVTVQTPTISVSTPRISISFSDGGGDHFDRRQSVPSVNVFAAENEPQHHDDEIADHPRPPPEPVSDVSRGLDPRRLTLGVRPLPPEDPSDNPEQRANRIRSFYKEYFDDSKPAKEEPYEDYGMEYYGGDDAYYDPETGEYYDYYDEHQPPYAEPVTRRAMTPPPRAPPRFQGAARHMATNSAGGGGHFPPPGPRAFSSASGRIPGARGPRKPAPPPSPLHVLPTPHMLKDDAIMSAADFAPGKNFRDQREGRPETPRGGLRPFSPMIHAHSPLVSSFDELSVIPSPHALRKSGTFTNLDFVPPPRFKNQDTASDAGSIRSNRTGISTMHASNIRAGAYRLSRLPAQTVGTKDDIMAHLRPKWDMGQ